jgi:cytochrome c-type biogenesis protein CcmF
VGLPRSAWGSAIAHAGVGVTVIGIAATAWNVETLGVLKPGQSMVADRYSIVLQEIIPRTGSNYLDDVGIFTILRDGNKVGSVESMKRIYITRNNMPTTEAGIATFGVSQIYVSLGEPQADGGMGVRLYFKPLVLLIWLGALVMAFGAGLSLTDRRYRVGAATGAKAKAAPSSRALMPAE